MIENQKNTMLHNPFSPSLEQRIDLRQTISLYQLLQTQQLLAIHPTALDLVLNSIQLDPKGTEKKLKKLGQEYDASQKVQALFGEFMEGKRKTNTGYDSEAGGVAITFPMSGLSTLIKKEVMVQYTPDVTYIGKPKEKPEIRYATHLVDAPRMELKLLDEFPESKKLYKILSKEREWITKTLREFYFNLGNFQREFVFTQDAQKLNIYGIKECSKELAVHTSTVSRLRRGRYISIIDSQEKQRIYPVAALMPNKVEYEKIHFASQLNYLLEEEAKEQKGQSDDWLAVHSGLARRTVTKYRTDANIPNSKGRSQVYRDNPVMRYGIKFDLEVKQ